MNRLALALLLAATSASAQTVRIKLGTLAPQGSTWHQLLLEMAQKWSQASNGQVELKPPSWTCRGFGSSSAL